MMPSPDLTYPTRCMRLHEGFDLDGRAAGFQEIPLRLQFRTVDLCPRLNEPLLRLRQTPAQAVRAARYSIQAANSVSAASSESFRAAARTLGGTQSGKGTSLVT